jgi:hypothetical protein
MFTIPPATFATPWTAPNSVRAWSIAAAVPSSVVTSTLMVRSVPGSPAAFSTVSAMRRELRSTPSTLEPTLSSRRVAAPPIPPPAPVTM